MSSNSAKDFPKHVAIIMDGNGRWARRRMMPRLEGHRQGAKAVRRAVEFCRRNSILVLTLYAFSTENWQRPAKEVSGLMKLLSQFVDTELQELHSHDIQIRIMGQMERIPGNVRKKLLSAIDKTANNKSMILNIALSYGGREDIVRAAKGIAAAVRSGNISENELNEKMFSEYLDTRGLSDPDLLIRTGGELRISNFLLWQAAYSELYFTEVLWPDFNDAEFMSAIETFKSRQRRFGKISEQIESGE